MKSLYEKFIGHLAKNLPVYVMVFLMFLAFCSCLNVQIDNLKDTLRTIIKVASFIAFVFTTAYLFYDVVYTVESKNGIIQQNNNRIKELEDKKGKILNEDMPKATKTKITRSLEDAYSAKLSTEEFNFFIGKLDEADRQQIELRRQSLETWKWKIVTLIALNGTFISIAKFF